jgi:hypothetical protein
VRQLLLSAAAVVAGAASVGAQTMRTATSSRPIGSERTLRATIDFGAGALRVMPARPGELYRMQLRYDADRNTPVNEYDARTGILRLGVESNGGAGIRVTSRAQLDQRAEVNFAQRVPIILAANLGASEATLELGGMTLASLAVRGGASRTQVRFAAPTAGECTAATFSLGAGELEVIGLANSGCAEIRVDGGVGRATLSFDGVSRRSQHTAISISMGGVTLRFPEGTAVQLVTSRFLAALEADGFERVGNTWTTPGFEQAPRKMTLELKASAAGVKVEWIPR